MLAQVRPAGWEFWLPVGATIGVVALGIWVIYRAKRWHEEYVQEEPLFSPQEQLQRYQEMMEAGELDPQEFARIQEQIAKQTADPIPPTNQPPDMSAPEK